MKVTLFFLFLSHILSHLIFVMPIKVARRADDQLLEKQYSSREMYEFTATLVFGTLVVQVVGSIASQVWNGHGSSFLPDYPHLAEGDSEARDCSKSEEPPCHEEMETENLPIISEVI
jgi:hypothetical protein